MKRYLHPIYDDSITLYEAIYSMDNLKQAHKNARKNKTWYKDVKMIDENPDLYLQKLQESLINKTYKTSNYDIFSKKEGTKNRIIYKLPYYPDRICQWAVLQVIEPILIKNFIYDTYSAIPNRGIHKCLQRVKTAVQNNPIETKYCLKLDIKQYYPSIDHNILKQKYRRLFKDKNLLWLLDEIIDSISTKGISDIKDVQVNKSIEEVGIPIGNYLSQYSANLYLSSFDHWIKEVIGIKYYYRYMDDIVILHSSKEYLHELLNKINNYLQTELKLNVKDNWQIFPSAIRGIDFVGYRIFNNYTLLRKSTCKSFKTKMRYINKKCSNGKEMNYSNFCAIYSYKGWLKWCDSYKLQQKYINPIEKYSEIYYNKYIKEVAI